VGGTTGVDVAVSRIEVGVSELMLGCAEGRGVELGSDTAGGTTRVGDATGVDAAVSRIEVWVSELMLGCAEGKGVERGSDTAVGAGVSVSLLCKKRWALWQPPNARAINRIKASQERLWIMLSLLLSSQPHPNADPTRQGYGSPGDEGLGWDQLLTLFSILRHLQRSFPQA
jgi:hypothetical protein